MKNREKITYGAKYSYQKGSGIEEYNKERFSGVLGKYRYYREQKAIASLIEMIPGNSVILDCPCGNGRWWSLLSKKAKSIIAVDISRGMITYAKQQAKLCKVPIDIRMGDVENLLLPNNSVDYVFSHALTKHLPVPLQYQVLSEFSRVAKRGVICSFGIFSHITYELWRHRHIPESYPVFIEELSWMANAAKLKMVTKLKCTTPLGLEYSVLFSKLM
jgi:ubiquinone/menaquinone biosynthesis C-methylase UbiE